MSRIWFVLAFVIASCATAPHSTQPAMKRGSYILVPYGFEGFGGSGPSVGGTSTLAVADIGPALDVFLSPAGDELILLPNRLDKSKLDFSLESLKTVDSWLADIHKINELQSEKGRAGELLMQDGRGENSVTFAGLYLGEVVRANSGNAWSWQRFDTFLSANPYFMEHYGSDAGLDAFVLVGPQGVATPINTALKRVLNGREESVAYIGEWLLQPVDLRQALNGQHFYGLMDID